MGIKDKLNPLGAEADQQLIEAVINCVTAVAAIGASTFIGIEIGGRSRGRKGLSKEVFNRVVNEVKEVVDPKKKK